MNITAFDIYLITLCDDIRLVFRILCVVSTPLLVIGAMMFIAARDEHDEAAEKLGHKILTRGTVCALLFLVIQCVVPSTKTAALMVSVPAVVNSAMMQKDVPEGIRRLWNKLTEQESGNKEVKDAKSVQESM